MRGRSSALLLKGFELIKAALPQGNAASLSSAATSSALPQWASLRGFSSVAGAGRTAAAAARASQGSSPSNATHLGAALQRTVWAQAARQLRQAGAGQKARGFSYLQFPRRSGGLGRTWGTGVGRVELDPDKVVWGLIGVNGLVFLLWRSNPALCWQHFTVSIDSLRQGRLHTAATAAFSHQDFYHFAANMIGLYFFGRDVGRLFGDRKLLALYVAGGVAGSLAHCGWYFYQACKNNQGRYGRRHFFSYAPPALGASAAVNAIMVVDILLIPTRTILLYGIIPMPAALLGALWLLRDVTGTMEGKGHIAHAGHLGGAALGLAFYALFRTGRIRPRGWY